MQPYSARQALSYMCAPKQPLVDLASCSPLTSVCQQRQLLSGLSSTVTSAAYGQCFWLQMEAMSTLPRTVSMGLWLSTSPQPRRLKSSVP